MNQKQLITIAALASFAMTAQAETIVNWGATGGDTGIVTGNANGTYGTTYTGTYVSPANGTNGYSTSVLGQTREYYGAMDVTGGVFGINNLTGGDSVQMVKNFSNLGGTVNSMIAWESPDFLTSDRELESFTMQFETRGGNGSTAKYLIETTAGWYQSVQTLTDDDLTTISSAVGDLTWTAFTGFGITDTTGGAAADTDNIISVGAYFSSSIDAGGGNWTGAKLQYFEVTAIPEPGTYALLGGLLALGHVMVRRRR